MDVFSGELKSSSTNNLFQPDSCLAPFPQTPYPVFTDPPQPQKLRPIRRNSDDPSDTPCLMNEARCEMSSSSYISTVSKAFQDFKVETDAQILQLISQGRSLEPEFSSSSDDDGESSEAVREPTNRKRKRPTRKSLELLMENIMRKVLYNQERMHRHLLEILEKNEEARINREEAWKQQETERARRDEELRREETSRSLALISYIQDLLGHQIQIPKSSCEVSCSKKSEQELVNLGNCDKDPSNREWRKSEVQSLITVRAALDHKFLNGHKGSLWELVAARLFRMGYNRTAKKCKEKWKNINNYYRKTLESEKSCPGLTKSCPYFQELDIIYKSGLITSVNATKDV